MRLFVVEDLESGEAAGHREVVTAEGRGMDDAAIEAAECFLIDGAARDDRANGT